MDFATVVSAVSSVGFPIVVCLVCFWYINKNSENMRETIDNNTRVMTRICTILKIDEDEVIKNEIK